MVVEVVLGILLALSILFIGISYILNKIGVKEKSRVSTPEEK